jgi:adenylate kinase family enzyme
VAISSRPGFPQQDPEQLLRGGESAARSLSMQGKQLLTKGEVFENEILAGTKSAKQPT